ncbi:MAG: aminoacyl-histidine dipeptidase [Prevotellaceae bacterium]|nr:aminoacyl-histidine dipeptidase [Candidatus Minthosoma caballi]
MENFELKPQLVFDYFSQINQVPRPSKHEDKIIAFLQEFAKKNNLDCKTDAAGNVLISKPATKGMESKPTIVLQSHMDMVCEKTSDCSIDFDNDPIETYIDGEWMRAKGTTLGADDGIGCAIQMALLTDNTIEHGPIECLFTVDEETGLTGAFELKPGFFTGKYLLNLDSEDEGEIFVGCAGGANTEITLSLCFEQLKKSYFPLRISIDNLRGGHSGGDIHDHRANAIKILSRFIYKEMNKYDVKLIDFQGGNLHNAIPRQAEAIIAVPFDKKEDVRIDFNIFASEIESEYPDEKDVIFFLESSLGHEQCIEQNQAEKIVNALVAVYNGVYEMSVTIPGLVETSTNLASAHFEEGKLKIVTSQRSSIGSQREAMSATVASVFKLIGANVLTGDGYPGWKPNLDSKILKVAIETYKQLFGKEPKVKAIHAGLECGLFSEKYPGLDMISFGPTLRGVHSPDEALLIPTVEMVWKHILAIISQI